MSTLLRRAIVAEREKRAPRAEVQITIRFSEPLHERLASVARAENVSLNGLVTTLCTVALEDAMILDEGPG